MQRGARLAFSVRKDDVGGAAGGGCDQKSHRVRFEVGRRRRGIGYKGDDRSLFGRTRGREGHGGTFRGELGGWYRSGLMPSWYLGILVAGEGLMCVTCFGNWDSLLAWKCWEESLGRGERKKDQCLGFVLRSGPGDVTSGQHRSTAPYLTCPPRGRPQQNTVRRRHQSDKRR